MLFYYMKRLCEVVMWQKTFSKAYKGIQKEVIWRVWSDVNNWPKWDNELKYCYMDADFSEGNEFIVKPKNGPKVLLFLSELVPNHQFTAYCKFFAATLYGTHKLEETSEGLKITNMITVTGPLTVLWTNLVAKNVAKAIPQQTDNLVEYARSKHE